MNFTDVVQEMKTYARQHPHEPGLDENDEIRLVDSECERIFTLDGREINIILSYNVITELNRAFWHLSITPRNKQPLPIQLVNEIVVSFFDTSLTIIELSDEIMEEMRVNSPYQQQFSQEAL